MKYSNAAVDTLSDNHSAVQRQKPRLRSVETPKTQKTHMPRLSQADALKDAIRRTG